MAVSTRDRAAVAHRGEEARAWAARGAIRAVGRPDRKGGREAVLVAPPGGGWSGRWARSGWSRSKFGVALAVGLVLALVLWAATQWGRMAEPGPAAAGSVLVVWHQPGEDQARLTAVDRRQWQDFVASQRAERARSRQEILDKARSEMASALAPLFDDMKGRIKDYSNWFYFFPTTYRMAFTAVIAALSRDAGDARGTEQVASDAISGLMRDQFIALVVVPERFGPAVEAKVREVFQHAIANELAAAETLNRALAAFVAEHGRPADGDRAAADQPLPVVLSWEALGIPADASSMAAPPDAAQLVRHDPALGDLQSSAGAEGSMLVARQVARRTVQVALNSATTAVVMPLLVGMGPVSAVASPVLGLAAFAFSLGAEFGTVKVRQGVEGPHFTEVSETVLAHLRETQTRDLADAVVKRIDTWLGG